MNLGEFVNNIIKFYLTEKELKTHSSFNRHRLDNIERKLFNINNQLAKILNNKKLVIDILENETNQYLKLLSKQFILFSKNPKISTKEA